MINQPITALLNKTVSRIGALVLLGVALAACQSAAVPPLPPVATSVPVVTSAPEVTAAPVVTEPVAAPAATTQPEAAINVATDAKLGKILVDGKGMTLYVFMKDEPDKSNCSGKCIENWPPLLIQGHPTLGEGVDDSMVGTVTLADGSTVVTYDHMPLYTFIKDKAPGDITGQGSNDVWYVVAPDGKAVGKEATINVAEDPKLGKILVDGKGMTLYMYTKDEPDKSNCSGKCIEFWPPLLTQGHPKLGEGVDASMVGTATLADGSMIVTYNHMPLYYWVKDKAPGDTTGQGNNNVWYVVASNGKPVGMDATINVAEDPKLGKILVDGKGMTLYMFTKDEPDKSNCSGKCIENWPPLLTQGHPTLGEGVDASMIGTATLGDGSTIVTYNHMPLYYWVKDKAPGDTTGQGNNNVWYVVAPDGTVVGR